MAAVNFRKLPVPRQLFDALLGVYVLDVTPAVFAHLYIAKSTYTLAWVGSLEFSHLETIAVDSLSKAVTEGAYGLTLSSDGVRAATTVSFIYRNRLERYHVANKEQDIQYRKALGDPGNIAFARYDVHYTLAKPAVDYVMTAENPRVTTDVVPAPAVEAEVTIQLPRDRRPSYSLAEWIISHHANAGVFGDTVDRGSFVETLGKLVEG